MRLNKFLVTLISVCAISNTTFYTTANAVDQVIPDYNESFVPEIKNVRSWLAGGEKSMTFHLKIETKIKKNSIWRVVAQVNTVQKTERITCQIPSGIDERGQGGSPETGHAQAIPNEKRAVIDSEYSLVTYEFQSTSRVAGSGFPFCQADYYLAYLAVYSTSGGNDSYSLPFDSATKKILPLINLASPWANWYPDKIVPPCQEPVKSGSYGVAWRTACQIKFTWPSAVLIESNKSADDIAAEQAAFAFKSLNDSFEKEKEKFATKIQRYLATPQLPTSYRSIFEKYMKETQVMQVTDQNSLRSYLNLLRSLELKADALMVRALPASITCMKGKVSKIVKGPGAKCPSGYKKK
jgi:hypothetical protein